MKIIKSLPLGCPAGQGFGEQHSGQDSPVIADSPPPPLPPERAGRSTAVWRQWLSSMAENAEAALAAAIAYREMDREGRERWLSSLEVDAPAVQVPRIALYAPLIAVEDDPERRERLLSALGDVEPSSPPTTEARALKGRDQKGTQIYVLSTPLYLNFVQILACGVSSGCFQWVRHDPIVGSGTMPARGEIFEAACLDEIPFKSVLDELALAVLSHKRCGEPLPEALGVLSDFLGAVGP